MASLAEVLTGSSTIIGAPSTTCAPVLTESSRTIPAKGARSVCSIFIASITASLCPKTTRSPIAARTASTRPCIGALMTLSPPAACILLAEKSLMRTRVWRPARKTKASSAEKNAAVGGWSDTGNRKRRAIFAITDASFCVLAIDHQRQRDISRAAELKTITCRPRRIVFCSGILSLGCRVPGPATLKQRCGPESGGCAIRLARYCAQCSKTAIDKSSIDLAVAKRRRTAQACQKGHIGTNPGDRRGIEGFGKTLKRASTGRCARDEFGNHWIVKRRNCIAAFDPAIDPDSARPVHCHNLSGRRQKTVFRIFGIDSRLDGVSVEADIVLNQRQLFTRGHTELPFDEIKTGGLLGHRILDLQTRVHFDEPERFAAQSARTIGDEFDSAGTAISDRFRRSHGGVADLTA